MFNFNFINAIDKIRTGKFLIQYKNSDAFLYEYAEQDGAKKIEVIR